ncbi:Brix-domain-containing protein [Eremomyces bilateralis CBS 781.70]|uniref:Brix-domain-containing protein n=1 Tax=Eremomyces bilateralis CBS 781.70 TaxID=1392243 RepID=A0A6G1FU40_9PEZI|nr:Brix-domain-containing protein [Eremomyces bilateralis CBS 781.70]KAF1809260.1 Brix-domain-containing protein [Eremomyces bilateralis CBS 781.70]
MAAVYKSLTNGHSKGSGEGPALRKDNRQKVLLLSSRGVTYRHRHLLNDLHALLPHSRRESKLDTKTKLYQLNELAELYNCNNVLFFEARKGKDLYLWLSKPPNGPTIKMHVQNLHTMDELHFTGNCLKGSRPILSFDGAFDSAPHLQLLKEIFTHTFGVPPGARKSKPFIDHVLSFTILDGKIWIRCFQIGETESTDKKSALAEDGALPLPKSAKRGDTNVSLVEIGPRFVLTPIVMLESSFGGPVIYENKEFVSPNQVRSELRMSKAGRFQSRAKAGGDRKARIAELGLSTEAAGKGPKDPLDEKVLFS